MLFRSPDAFDVTLYTWYAAISQQLGSPTKLSEFDVELIENTTDQLKISLTTGQTDALPDRAYWDIQGTLISDTTKVQTYLKGTIVTTRQPA